MRPAGPPDTRQPHTALPSRSRHTPAGFMSPGDSCLLGAVVRADRTPFTTAPCAPLPGTQVVGAAASGVSRVE